MSAEKSTEHPATSDDRTDFAIAVEELTELVRAGDRIACEQLIARHPLYKDELQDLLSTLAVLATWREDSGDVAQDVRHELPLDRRLGDYRILREIGRGGMGIVYEAEQISLDRRVALKVLPMAAFLDDRQLRRFKNEARAAAALQHPNIVSVHGVGCERSIHFYAMELIDGPNLATVIAAVHGPKERTASPEMETKAAASLSTQRDHDNAEFHRSAARLGIKTASALHAAHQEGIVHRDIKPANLLLDRNGELHIADFGLARFTAGEDLTFTGDQLGTLRYMSPEQVESEPGIDHTTDIYSLGVTLYEFLTGEPAFPEQARAKLAKAVVEREPVPLTQLDPRIPRDLETIVLKAISKESTDRYATAREFSDDLDRFIRGRSIAARPATISSRAVRFARRNPSVILQLAIATLSFALLAIGASYVAWQFSQKSQLQQREAYASDMLLAKQAVVDANFLAAQRTLLRWVPSDSEVDLRGLEWSQLWRESHPRTILRSIQRGIFGSDVAFQPNGDLLVEANYSTNDPVWNWRNKDPTQNSLLTADIGSHRAVSLEALNLIAMGDTVGRIRFWDWSTLQATGEELQCDVVTGNEIHINSIDMDPSNSHLVVGTMEYRGSLGKLTIWSAENRWEKLFEQQFQSGVAAGFADPTHIIYTLRDEPHIHVLALENDSWKLVNSQPLSGGPGRALNFAKDRDRFALTLSRKVDGLSESWIEVHSADDLELQYRLGLGAAQANFVDISPDGNFVAAGDDEGYIWVGETEGPRAVRRKMHHRGVTSVRFSPDNSVLATTGADCVTQLSSVRRLFDDTSVKLPTTSFAPAFVAKHTVCTPVDNQRIIFCNSVDGSVSSQGWKLDRPNGINVSLAYNAPKQILIASGNIWPKTTVEHGSYVAFWDVAREQPVGPTIELATAMPLQSNPVSPDGRFMAISRGKELLLIDFEDFSVRRTTMVSVKPIFCADFSSDGKSLVVATDDIQFLSVADFAAAKDRMDFRSIRQMAPPITGASGSSEWTFPHMTFVPGTDELAIICGDRTIKIFDGGTGKLLRESNPFPDTINHISVSPDGKRFGVSSTGGYFRIVTNPDFLEVAKFTIDPGLASSSFSPDGRQLLVPLGDSVQVIGDPTGELFKMTRMQLEQSSNIDAK